MNWSIDGPSPQCTAMVRKFWWSEDPSTKPVAQKIIPDGYPELIFHHGDPFKINISGSWERQDLQLVAGQIRKHFLLSNTGKTKIFGIKLQPWALQPLLDVEMSQLTDKVVSMDPAVYPKLRPLLDVLAKCDTYAQCTARAEDFFSKVVVGERPGSEPAKEAIKRVIATHGRIDMKTLLQESHLHERTLERYFKRVVGLSPKFYARIMRFTHIIHLAQQKPRDWSQIAYYAGYYDQSHFIKNFKEFTGEEPSSYGFTEETLANLHFKI